MIKASKHNRLFTLLCRISTLSTSLATSSHFLLQPEKKANTLQQILNRAALAQPDIKNLLKNAEIAIFTYPEELQEGSIVAYIPKTALDERVRFACLFLNRASANFQKNGLSLEGRAIVPFDFDIQATQILMVIAIDKSTYESSMQSVLDAVTEAINLYG